MRPWLRVGAGTVGRNQQRQAITVSSESIASPPSPVGSPEPCRGCGAPLADDQRYCLECGERRTPMSSVLLGGPPATSAPPREPPSAPPGAAGADGDGGGRSSAVTVIAGVGVLLLAMGVGVLIGRSGGGKQVASAPQVITVQGAGAGTSTPATETATFTDDWPSGTSGYTVQLQTLPVTGTQVSAVEAAKSSASAKGAKAVGALKSEDFSSLPAGSYVIYSGVYHKQAEAQKALSGLKKSFPGAKVVKVSSAEATGGSSSSGAKAGAGAGSSPSNPAPPSVLDKLKQSGAKGPSSGKTYEQESKKLPDVVETG